MLGPAEEKSDGSSREQTVTEAVPGHTPRPVQRSGSDSGCETTAGTPFEDSKRPEEQRQGASE